MAVVKRQPLSRRRILEAAVRFVDREGLEALSMRKLGSELGVEAMSLYN
ncbi:MAG: TetR family transcriptional regulator, partial [Actinomycetota bacterium]|nr:TetR family transcriptional regulator [Actinomycetota bacterium]